MKAITSPPLAVNAEVDAAEPKLQPSIARFLRDNNVTVYRLEQRDGRPCCIIFEHDGRTLAVSYRGAPLSWRRTTVIHKLRHALREMEAA